MNHMINILGGMEGYVKGFRGIDNQPTVRIGFTLKTIRLGHPPTGFFEDSLL